MLNPEGAPSLIHFTTSTSHFEWLAKEDRAWLEKYISRLKK